MAEPSLGNAPGNRKSLCEAQEREVVELRTIEGRKLLLAEAEQLDHKTLQSKPLPDITLNKEPESDDKCSVFKSHQSFKIVLDRPDNPKVTHDTVLPHRENISVNVPMGTFTEMNVPSRHGLEGRGKNQINK